MYVLNAGISALQRVLGGGSSLLLHLEFRGVSQDSGKIFETMPLLPSCQPNDSAILCLLVPILARTTE